MTVSNTDSSITYTGNGATTVFPYAFLIPTSGDAQVIVYDSVTMTEVELTVGVDCTISGLNNPLGGNVTYNPSGVPIPATKNITIRRVLALTQTLDLTRQSNYDPTSLESELDRIVMMIQQLNTELSEDILTVPVGSSITVNDIIDASLTASSAATAAAASAAAAAASAAAAATFDPNLYIAKALLTTRGDIITRGAAAPQRLGLGTANYGLLSDGTDVVWGAVALPSRLNVPQNFAVAASVNANALTLAIKGLDGNDPSATNPVNFQFRNATLTDGKPVNLAVTAPNSLVITNGSVMGVSGNNVPFRLWFGLFNDAGTLRLGLVNVLSGVDVMALRPGLLSATAEGGAGGADSAQVIYANAAVASKPFIVLGYLEWATGLPAIGAWSAAPSTVKLWQPGDALPGNIVQTAITQTGAVATGTGTIPNDDTIPQITEGDQYMSKAITPSSPANLLNVIARGHFSSTANNTFIMALFQDATANALASIRTSSGGADSTSTQIPPSIDFTFLAGVSVATTLRIRCGSFSANTMTFNGVSGSRLFGGVLNSFLKISEITA